MDDLLIELLKGQYIDIEMFLENTSMPFAGKILDTIRKKKEAMETEGMPQRFSPDEMTSIKEAANPEAVRLLQKALEYKI